jgi:hypothetical protein
VSTRREAPNTRRIDSTETSAGQVSRERLGSTVTVLAIEQAFAELGIHASLSDIVTKAQSIENGSIKSRSRRKRERTC